MKKIKKALDPRMEEKKTAKHDPWVTGGGYGYSSRDGSAPSSPPTLRPPSNTLSTNYWSSTTAEVDGKAEAMKRSSQSSIPYQPSPKPERSTRAVDLSEDQQLKIALELSRKEEEERQRQRELQEKEDRDLQYALEVSKRDTQGASPTKAPPVVQTTASDPFGFNTLPAAPPASGGASLYEQEAVFQQSLSAEETSRIIQKQQDASDLEAVFKGDGQKRNMQQYGFADCCRLWGAGDCAVLVCLVCHLLMEGRITYDDVERQFGHQAVDVSGERRSLLQWLYENAMNYPEIRDSLLMEAEIKHPHTKNPIELIQLHITKMARDGVYLGVAEMAAGPYRDNYILVFVRERPHDKGGGLEVAQMIAPATASTVFYTLFSDSGHFDMLRPLPISMTDQSLFAGAPWNIRQDLQTLYRERLGGGPAEPASQSSLGGMLESTPSAGASTSTNPWDTPSEPLQPTGSQTASSGKKSGDLWSNNEDLFGGLTSQRPSSPQKKTLNQMGTRSPQASGVLTPENQQSVNSAAADKQKKMAELQAQLKAMSMGPSIRPPMGGYNQGMMQPNTGMGYGGGGGGGYPMNPMMQQGMGMGMGGVNMGMQPQQPYGGGPGMYGAAAPPMAPMGYGGSAMNNPPMMQPQQMGGYGYGGMGQQPRAPAPQPGYGSGGQQQQGGDSNPFL